MEYPGKSCPTCVKRLSYLKESSTDTKEPKLLATCRLALQINSSTFGTLLSSQGSSAHRAQPPGLAAGQPGKTYRVGLAPSNRGRASRPPRAPPPPSRSEADRARTRATSVEVLFKGFRLGAGHQASGLASRRSLATEKRLRSRSVQVKSLPRGPDHNGITAGQSHFGRLRRGADRRIRRRRTTSM